MHRMRHGIVPPYLLEQLARSAEPAVAGPARRALLLDRAHRELRAARAGAARPAARAPVSARRTVSDAHGTQDLPGEMMRADGAGPTGDASADEAYDGLGATWSLFHEVYGRDSLDGAGLRLDATVHYGRDYDNAFWDGERMVFGDGDGQVFGRFTAAVDVIGHELTHGVTEKSAGLTYQGQSGALNESISDVFGSLVKQRVLGQDATSADWLIGAGLFTARVHGVALRSMKAPGTAYDDPTLGRDPQPATMGGYVETSDDNGGVHLNSGIPNHAFYLAATAIGGRSWQGAGVVWYDVLTGGAVSADADFADFAALTAAAAAARFGQGSAPARAVQDAWRQVGVTGSGVVDAGAAVPAGAAATVLVQRSGGFAGRRLEREVALQALPSAQSERWRSLLVSGRLHALPPVEPAPDRFVYRVRCTDAALDVTTGEQQLPPDVREVLEQTLLQA